MKLALALLFALAACDKPPTRPDEAKFRAADPTEKCNLMAPRAVRCADELLVAQLRSMGGPDGADISGAVAEDLEKNPKQLSDEDRRAMHVNMCLGSLNDGYVNAVFDCWSVAGCKQFADCVMKPAPPKPPRRTP